MRSIPPLYSSFDPDAFARVGVDLLDDLYFLLATLHCRPFDPDGSAARSYAEPFRQCDWSTVLLCSGRLMAALLYCTSEQMTGKQFLDRLLAAVPCTTKTAWAVATLRDPWLANLRGSALLNASCHRIAVAIEYALRHANAYDSPRVPLPTLVSWRDCKFSPAETRLLEALDGKRAVSAEELAGKWWAGQPADVRNKRLRNLVDKVRGKLLRYGLPYTIRRPAVGQLELAREEG